MRKNGALFGMLGALILVSPIASPIVGSAYGAADQERVNIAWRPDQTAGAQVAVPMTIDGFDPAVARANGFQVTPAGADFRLTKGGTSMIVPTKRLVGNCGTSFIHLARVGGDKTRATYGFEHLRHRAVHYDARASFMNEDTHHVETDSAAGPLLTRTHFERRTTQNTGSGTVTVYAHVHTTNANGSTCTSSPALYDSIFVY